MQIKKTCKICGKEFEVKPYRIHKAKYCSHKCYWKTLIGKSPTNKGMKYPERSGKNNPSWKRGYYITSIGYFVFLKKNHPNASVDGYIHRSRYVMGKHIGRLLKSNEIIHHINGNKLDDRIENLKLVTRSIHAKIHNSYPHKKKVNLYNHIP